MKKIKKKLNQDSFQLDSLKDQTTPRYYEDRGTMGRKENKNTVSGIRSVACTNYALCEL